jgi:hypothetical protein
VLLCGVAATVLSAVVRRYCLLEHTFNLMVRSPKGGIQYYSTIGEGVEGVYMMFSISHNVYKISHAYKVQLPY